MFTRVAAVSTSGFLLVLAGGLPATTSAQDAVPAPLGAAEIREMFDELSNWGRWGENDQRGTLNLITPAKRVAAARRVLRLVYYGLRDGEIRCLSQAEAG